MLVTVEELKSNLDHYLDLIGKEDIVITKNGLNIAALTEPPKNLSREDKLAILDQLTGIIPSTVDEDRDIMESLEKKHGPF